MTRTVHGNQEAARTLMVYIAFGSIVPLGKHLSLYDAKYLTMVAGPMSGRPRTNSRLDETM